VNRRRRLGLRIGAVACAASLGLIWWPSAAGAQGEAEVGWWYRLSGAEGEPSTGGAPAEPAGPPPTAPPLPAPFPTVPLPEDPPAPPVATPPPASVPEGGLYVANDTLGPLAMSAMRFHEGQVGETRLTLQFAEGGTGGGLPVVACPLLEGFEAVSNGAWRDRPAHDCARAISRGTINADGSMSFILSAAFQLGGQSTLDIVLLPEPGNGTPFSAPFQAVSPDALEIIGAAPNRPVPSSPANLPTSPATSSSFDADPRPAGSASRPQPAAPRPGSATAPTPAGGGAAAPAPASTGAAETVADVFEEKPWVRWVATALLVALALSLAAASNDRLRDAVPALARLGGRRGDDPSRGVGRFARTRAGRPPALT